MTVAALVKDEIAQLCREGASLLATLRSRRKRIPFETDYQRWYSRVLQVVQRLAPDRLAEFKSYYEANLQRKWLDHETYTIQDYFTGNEPTTHSHCDFDCRAETARCLANQLAIFQSLVGRVEFALTDLEDQVLFRLQVAELEAARGLIGISARAAGALAGAAVEHHLLTLARRHRCRGSRHKPRLADLNTALHGAGVFDAQVHRQLAWMADLRERCVEKQQLRPTRAQVRDLVDSAHWLIKNVF